MLGRRLVEPVVRLALKAPVLRVTLTLRRRARAARGARGRRGRTRRRTSATRGLLNSALVGLGALSAGRAGGLRRGRPCGRRRTSRGPPAARALVVRLPCAARARQGDRAAGRARRRRGRDAAAVGVGGRLRRRRSRLAARAGPGRPAWRRRRRRRRARRRLVLVRPPATTPLPLAVFSRRLGSSRRARRRDRRGRPARRRRDGRLLPLGEVGRRRARATSRARRSPRRRRGRRARRGGLVRARRRSSERLRLEDRVGRFRQVDLGLGRLALVVERGLTTPARARAALPSVRRAGESLGVLVELVAALARRARRRLLLVRLAARPDRLGLLGPLEPSRRGGRRTRAEELGGLERLFDAVLVRVGSGGRAVEARAVVVVGRRHRRRCARRCGSERVGSAVRVGAVGRRVGLVALARVRDAAVGVGVLQRRVSTWTSRQTSRRAARGLDSPRWRSASPPGRRRATSGASASDR